VDSLVEPWLHSTSTLHDSLHKDTFTSS